MGFFDFFKKKKKKLTEKDLAKKVLESAFPGGPRQLDEIVQSAYTETRERYSKDTLEQAVRYIAVGLRFFQDRSVNRIIDQGLMPKNLVSREDGIVIYKIVLKNVYADRMGNNKAISEYLYKTFGNIEGEPVGDVMPGAFGPYGLATSNPIPVAGVPASYEYLSRLRLPNGEKVKYQRLGSFGSEITREIIDGYQIYDQAGNEIAVVYICPYMNAHPSKAPEGFIIA